MTTKSKALTAGCGTLLLVLLILLPLFPPLIVIEPRKRAQGETAAVAMAVKLYKADYGRFPDFGGGGDGTKSMRIIEVLVGTNARGMNHRETVYLELSTTDMDGTFLDPWGTQYRVLLDDDGDGRIEYLGEQINEPCLVISTGYDKMFGTSNDIRYPKKKRW